MRTPPPSPARRLLGGFGWVEQAKQRYVQKIDFSIFVLFWVFGFLGLVLGFL
jgi:hypothetical protein